MWHCDDNAEFDLLNDHTQGETSVERMRRIANCMVLKCCATVSCSEFNTLQRQLERDSQHLLQRWRKKKTDVEDLEPSVVGMCPCGICRDIECTTMTDGLRTSTFAFSKSKSEPFPDQVVATRAIGGNQHLGQLQSYHNLNLINQNFILLKSKAIKQ